MIAITLDATIMTIRFPNEVQQVSAQTSTVVISQLYNFKEPVGTTFLVYINVSDVTNLNGFMINISWNPQIIKLGEGDPNGIKPRDNATKYNIYFGSFLNTTIWGVHAVSNDEGWIKELWGARPSGGDSGNGTLAILNFTLLKTGTTKIKLSGLSSISPGKGILIDKTGQEIPHDEIDGIVSDQPPPANEFWLEPLFQITVSAVLVIAVILVVVSHRRKQKPGSSPKQVTDEDIEKLVV
jgi:hypothetical protein